MLLNATSVGYICLVLWMALAVLCGLYGDGVYGVYIYGALVVVPAIWGIAFIRHYRKKR